MRKIDKSKILSSIYFNWQNDLEINNTNHPKYDNKTIKNKYYTDILANLYFCQNGLCAYTEKFLVDKNRFKEENWLDGKFNNSFERKGELDHYNPKLKPTKAWLWDNFFMIDSDINLFKSNRDTLDILKPDSVHYNPEYYLEYDVNNHMFFPNSANFEYNSKEFNEVNFQINNVLLLNHDFIKDERRIYLNPFFKKIKDKIKTSEEIKSKLYQYFTAFDFSINQINHPN